MKETVCNFGPEKRLFGILTTPDEDVRIPNAPIALILNAGIVHRVGPFRIHVDIARQLAAAGFSTLRLDLSGLGDSAPRTGSYEIEDRAVLDVGDAMDFLQRETGVDQFALLGLCSGAYNAHRVAVKDKRIVGTVFLDGIVFRTFGYYFRRFTRYFRYRFWRNAIRRRLSSSRGEVDAETSAFNESEFFDVGLNRDVVVEQLNLLMHRDVQMLFLYTDGYDDIVGRSQFQEMYGLRPDDGQLQVEYYPKSEHTFRLIENRRAACDRITDWIVGRFAKPMLIGR
ncbi:alpha/beta hydrolase [Mariniblastus fucicola]|uniref:Alpha/beta hydrolase family protein n=1 Tax=Mariniblastus fucicola TaxID=980251 RepID=A0A5B9PAY8_9BACT|nr:alpha/beta fold hydrolase [Mariniblastus fucicola]QEG22140.1 Alpha/beta hydrolase family protein [Mariniblastus fucicola]